MSFESSCIKWMIEILRAILKQERTHFRILLGSAFHMNGPLYANQFLKICRLAYCNVTKLVDVAFLVSLTSNSLQIVMQSEI